MSSEAWLWYAATRATQHLRRCLFCLCALPTVTNHNQPTPKAFNFKLSPANADVLQQLRLGFVATANNHVLDYGQPGLKETNDVRVTQSDVHTGCWLRPGCQHISAQALAVQCTSLAQSGLMPLRQGGSAICNGLRSILCSRCSAEFYLGWDHIERST
jgi:hypothetical protein